MMMMLNGVGVANPNRADFASSDEIRPQQLISYAERDVCLGQTKPLISPDKYSTAYLHLTFVCICVLSPSAIVINIISCNKSQDYTTYFSRFHQQVHDKR